jgi:hypothetical protein
MRTFKEYLFEKRDEQEDENQLFGPGSPIDMLIHAHNLGRDMSSEMKSLILSSGKKTSSINESENKAVTDSLNNKDKAWHKRHESSDGYGVESGKPLTPEESKISAGNAVAAHYKKTPTDQTNSLISAAKRFGHVQYGEKDMTPENVVSRMSSDSGNKKTGMNVDHPLVGRQLSNGSVAKVHNNYGFGGNPVVHTQQFNSKDDSPHKNVKKCPHMTADCGVGHSITNKKGEHEKIGPSCLAQTGGYKFANTLAKLDNNDRARFGEKINPDHAILMAHMIKTRAEKAASLGKVNDHRFQVSDQHGDHGEAVAKAVVDAHPHLKEAIHMYDYNKDHNKVLSNLRLKKSGKYNMSGSFSHNGPAYHMDASGQRQINTKNLEDHGKYFSALQTAENEGLDHHTYLVRGGRSQHKDGTPFKDTETGFAHKQPKSNAAPAQKEAYINTDAAHTHTRYYGTTADHGVRVLKASEPIEHHDKESGTGHVSILQKNSSGGLDRVKIPYIQHLVNHVEGHGKVSPDERSDGAAGGVGHSKSQASSAVASGSTKAIVGENKNSLMHQMHDNTVLDRSSGILHVANPHVLHALGHTYNTKKVIPISAPKTPTVVKEDVDGVLINEATKDSISVVGTDGVLNEPRFKRGLTKIASLTDNNFHAKSIAHGARLLGRNDLAKKADDIEKEHIRVGYLSPELGYKRQDVYKELHDHAKKVLSPENAKKLYMSY